MKSSVFKVANKSKKNSENDQKSSVSYKSSPGR